MRAGKLRGVWSRIRWGKPVPVPADGARARAREALHRSKRVLRDADRVGAEFSVFEQEVRSRMHLP